MALVDYYNTGDDNGIESYAPQIKFGQTFTSSSAYSAVSVKLKGYRAGSPGSITVELYATAAGIPTGGVLATGTYNGDSLTDASPGEWFEITFSSAYTLTGSTMYAIVAYSEFDDINNAFIWRYDQTSPTYSGGTWLWLDEGSWSTLSGTDGMFEVYSGPMLPTEVPVDIVTVRRLIAIGNDQFFYEDI